MSNQKKEIVKVEGNTVKHLFKYADGSIAFRTKEGAIQLVAATVTLRQDLNEIHKVQGKPVIGVAGYNKLNKIANINIFPYPHEIPVHGKMESNPYVEVDPATDVVKRVHGNYIGVGYAPTGNVLMVTKPVNFDLQSYSQQKLVKMLADHPEIFQVGIQEWCPFTEEKPFKGDDGIWKCIDRRQKKTYVYKVLEKGDGVWVDQSHPEYREFLESHRDRTKFAERIAISIVKRNIMKEFIGASQVDIVEGDLFKKKDAKGKVTVYGIKHLWDKNQIEEMIHKAWSGDVGEYQMIQSDSRVEDEDVEVAEAEVVEDVEAESQQIEQNGAKTPQTAQDQRSPEEPGNAPEKGEISQPAAEPAAGGAESENVRKQKPDEESWQIRKDLEAYAKLKEIDLNKIAKTKFNVKLTWKEMVGQDLKKFSEYVRETYKNQ